jgi:hypothetical protein
MSDAEEISDTVSFEIGWLEIFWVIAGLVLIFQIWPNFYVVPAHFVFDAICTFFVKFGSLLSPFDVRKWGWRSYLVANGIAFVVLAIIRIRSR